MAEGLVLTNLESVAAHRAALVEDIPNILEAAGATTQAEAYRQGRYGEVVDWAVAEVSSGMHGFQQGKFGVDAEREADINPLAQKHDLIGPVTLWVPGDPIPEGQRPGNIAEYRVTGDPASLSAAVRKANVFIAQGATHDGMLGRIDNVLMAAANSERAAEAMTDPNRRPPEVVIFTGMRRTLPREGTTGLYLSTLPPDADPRKPIEEIHLSETDSALAILQSRCQRFELIDEIGDPDKDHKPVERIHPELGGRTWIARTYSARLTDDRGGTELLVTVVNGEPIISPERLNAGGVPAPLAVETMKDWFGIVESDEQLDAALSVTYAHLARIGSELLAQSRAVDRPLGFMALLGSMPQQPIWERLIRDERTGRMVHNGASLVLGELIPHIKAFNVLLGRPEFDISP